MFCLLGFTAVISGFTISRELMHFVCLLSVAVSATTGIFANMAPSIPKWEYAGQCLQVFADLTMIIISL